MAHGKGAAEHATTRYQRVEDALIEELQRRYRSGGDLKNVANWLTMEERRMILAETLDADKVLTRPTGAVTSGQADLGPMTDFKRAAVAELIYAESSNEDAGAHARARSLLEAAARSPTASPTLEYELLYRDLAEVDLLDEDPQALEWLKRSLAHNLRFYDGDDVPFNMVDLASGYLQLGQLDTGLEILTELIRRNPQNIMIYRFMATGFPTLGLTELGLRGVQRGLELLDEIGDPEEIEDELLMARVDLWASPKQGRESEVSSEVLESLDEALRMDFDAGDPKPPDELCRELVPDWEDVPVKRPLRFEDLPEPVRALIDL